jgi:hypothetical protein
VLFWPVESQGKTGVIVPRKEDPVAKSKRMKAYYAAHPEKAYERSRRAYLIRCGRVSASIPEFLSYLARSLRGSHRRRISTLTIDDLSKLWHDQEGLCAISRIPMTHRWGEGYVDTNISVDRIDNTKDYIVGNVRLVCHRINLMRGSLNDAELISWCRAVIGSS